MVSSLINDHIRARRHVTFDAVCPGRSGLVKMVVRRIVLLSHVKLQTDIVAFASKLRGVRLVAVTASHTSMKHTALDERAVLIDLVFDLTVREVKAVL